MIEKEIKMTEKSSGINNSWRRKAAAAVLSVTIATGGAGCDVIPTIEVNNSPVAQTALVSASAIPTEIDPTALSAIPTKSPEVTATPTYHVEAAGGEYTAEQDKINNSESATVQKARIQRWLGYWVNFDNRPFALDTQEIAWKYLYDDPQNPAQVAVAIEVGGEYLGRLFTVPIGDNALADFPPPVVGSDIQPGYGPLELTAGAAGQWLSVDKGIPVRKNSSGQIVETLNMETGQWEKESLIEGDIFFDPQTKEDFSKLVESPSPIDSPEAFAKWQDEYLKQINEKLNTYSGPSIDVANSGFDYQGASFDLISKNWPVIASYKFNWQGQEILTKTFILKDKNGNLIPLSLTYTTPDSFLFDSSRLYTTPSEEKEITLGIDFEWNDNVKKLITDNFAGNFLPTNETDSGFDSLRRVLASVSTEKDREIVAKSYYIMVRFN
jgi:hypothetical protein